MAAILKRSLRDFGLNASIRYRSLIRQALLDIEADHGLPGSTERSEIMVPGARTYHIALSRARSAGARVVAPTHFLLYRRREDGIVEVARVLHESRDLARQFAVRLPSLDGRRWNR